MVLLLELKLNHAMRMMGKRSLSFPLCPRHGMNHIHITVEYTAQATLTC